MWTGSVWAFVIALLIVLVWAVTGPYYGYSDTWQLVINTGTTIVTFLMVFLLQRTQTRDTMAIQLKLNEIVAALDGASNRLINAERLSDEEVHALYAGYQRLVKLGENSNKTGSISIEKADQAETLNAL
jgi:low affinity Fe/Cu permease